MLVAVPLLGVLGLSGCAMQPGYQGGYGGAPRYGAQPYGQSYANGCAGQGGSTLAGGGVGAAIGGLIGNGTAGRGHRGSGTLAGIVAGGLLGGLVGNAAERPCVPAQAGYAPGYAQPGYGYAPQPSGYVVLPGPAPGPQIQPYASGYGPSSDPYGNPPPVTGYGGVRY